MPTTPNPPHRRCWRWPLIIISILAVHAGIMLTAAAIALQKPGESAVIPDYYNQGQQWDQHRARMQVSKDLGWNITVTDAEPNSARQKQVRCTLLDAATKPVDQAALRVHCFHLSHGDQAATIDATLLAPGQYHIALPLNLPGFWQFDFAAKRGPQWYIQTVTQWVN